MRFMKVFLFFLESFELMEGQTDGLTIFDEEEKLVLSGGLPFGVIHPNSIQWILPYVHFLMDGGSGRIKPGKFCPCLKDRKGKRNRRRRMGKVQLHLALLTVGSR